MEMNILVKRLVSNLEEPALSIRNRIITGMLFLSLAGVGMAWHSHQSRPLTDAQRATLAAMVGETARKTGETRQKVWWRVKGILGVRRIEEIERRDFDKAHALLLQRIQTDSR
ncbi:MAG: hypothetical protein HQL99_13245 [Magnetococcales bacterium]|nr:hypothetical protein [Magnetococcales bacterium]